MSADYYLLSEQGRSYGNVLCHAFWLASIPEPITADGVIFTWAADVADGGRHTPDDAAICRRVAFWVDRMPPGSVVVRSEHWEDPDGFFAWQRPKREGWAEVEFHRDADPSVWPTSYNIVQR